MNQLKIGAALSYLSIGISMLIALIYTPILVRTLGQSEFGLYSLIGSLAAYFSVMDMGLGNAMVRYIARNRVLGNKKNEGRLNGLFLTFYSIIGLITIIVGIVVYKNLHPIFGGSLSESELDSAKIMVVILIVNFSISFPLSIFNSLMKAHERFITEKLVSIIRIVLSPLIILPIIFIGYGAISMVLITTIVNIGCLLFSMIYCFKKLKIKIVFGKIDNSLVKEILIYSFFVFLAVVVDQIYWQTDQIILGAISGTLSVAVYAIAMQFIKLYIQFSTSISGLFLPKTTIMVANKATNEELTEMMIKFGRLQYIVLTLILNGFILFGQLFIEYWVGETYENAYYVVLLIMIPLTIPLIQNVGISILYAKNLQAFRSIVLVIIALLNIIISIPVAKNYGVLGVASITALTILIGNILSMNIYYHKKVGLNILKFWSNILNITIPTTAILIVGFIINYAIPFTSIIYLIIKISIYSIIHLVLIYILVFNEFERNLVRKVYSNVKIKVFK